MLQFLYLVGYKKVIHPLTLKGLAGLAGFVWFLWYWAQTLPNSGFQRVMACGVSSLIVIIKITLVQLNSHEKAMIRVFAYLL